MSIARGVSHILTHVMKNALLLERRSSLLPNIERCLHELRQESIFVALFADEVQHLFVKGAARESLEVQIVSQILIIGKERNTFGVVSGSSSDVSRMVLKEKRQDPAEAYASYPDLNNSVYSDNRLQPPRNKTELTNAIQSLFPEWCADQGDELDAAYWHTGGIGRLIGSRVCFGVPIVPHYCGAFLLLEPHLR